MLQPDGHRKLTNEQDKVVKEFTVLLDKAQGKFHRLRDLPTFGGVPWQASYHKAFKWFSSLWKYQQDNRAVLTLAGLKRAEIGEIASKIGQLYYNFYLRTSDTRYLLESYTFYQAIHSRQYFQEAGSNLQLAIKELRFYARYLVVCLLLNKREDAFTLLQEFQALINSYIMRYSPADAADWQGVVSEAHTFLHADAGMPTPRSPGLELPFKPVLRCLPDTSAARVAQHTQRVKEVILVSYQARQVKIGELPIDLFRMMQAMEWQNSKLGGITTPHSQFANGSDSGSSRHGSANGGSSNSITGMVHAASTDHVSPFTAHAAAARIMFARSGSRPSHPPPGHQGAMDITTPGHANPMKHLIYRPTVTSLLNVVMSTIAPMAYDDILVIYLCVNSPEPAAEYSDEARDSAGANGTLSHAPLLGNGARRGHEDHISSAGHSTRTSANRGLHAQNSAASVGADADGLSAQSGSATIGRSSGAGFALRGSPSISRTTPTGSITTAILPPGSTMPSEREALVMTKALHLHPLEYTPDCQAADELMQPEDLLPMTRRQMLLIIDSDVSTEFNGLQGQELGRPLLCLMSPTAIAPGLDVDIAKTGSLFAMALSCPAMSMCVLCKQRDPTAEQLHTLQDILNEVFLDMAQRLLPELQDSAWGAACEDALVRRLLLHFILFRAAMALLPSTEDRPDLLPSCYPELPELVDEDSTYLGRILKRISTIFQPLRSAHNSALLSTSTSSTSSAANVKSQQSADAAQAAALSASLAAL